MPMNLRSYPKNWKAFSMGIRFGRAHGQCECSGECGKNHGPRRKDFRRSRCPATNGESSENGRGKVVLTTAHLWKGPCRCALENEGQKCAIRSHVKAFCRACHLLYDKPMHGGLAGLRRRRG